MLQFQALGSSPGITRLSSPLEFGKVMVGIFGMSTRQIPWETSPHFVASLPEHILHHSLLVDCHTLFSEAYVMHAVYHFYTFAFAVL